MDNRKLGVILLGISIVFIIAIVIFKIQIGNLVDALMIATGGNCISEGVCIHEQSDLPMYIGIAIVFATLALGIYLFFFEKSQKKIVERLEETKKDEQFEILLRGLDDYEKKAIREIKKQDGIMQNTLRIRTDMSKSKLSLVLSELERKGLIKRIPSGKTNKIHLKIGL